jgi:D-aminopeptidase
MATRPRVRNTGIIIGSLEPGPFNAITDVPNVRVGHVTLISGNGAHEPGKGPVRTGVTTVLPHDGNLFREKVPAGIFVLNGFGKCMGQEQVDELGVIEGPIAMTGTMNVGIVTDGIIEHAIRANPDCGVTTSTVNPVVTECSDAFLNDQHGRHVRQEHVLEAIASATGGPVAEGNVGAGTGMSLFGFKGGIGTASRRLSSDFGGYTVGAMVLGNCGRREELRINGAPVSYELRDWAPDDQEEDTGSIIILIATDAPMLDRVLFRLAKRAALGLARTGAIAAHGSGDYIIAFSTAHRFPNETDELTLPLSQVVETGPLINRLFQATVEATEEAIINTLFAAETMTGRDGNTRFAIPIPEVISIVERHGLMAPGQ